MIIKYTNTNYRSKILIDVLNYNRFNQLNWSIRLSDNAVKSNQWRCFVFSDGTIRVFVFGSNTLNHHHHIDPLSVATVTNIILPYIKQHNEAKNILRS